MKSKIVFGFLSLLLVVFIALLFIPENKSFKIISSPKIFSLLKSSENEDIKIELLVNKNDTYYFDEEYIASISLNSEFNEEIISVNIEEVTYSNNLYEYKNENFYLLELSLSININSEDYTISFEKAFLDISYNNQEELNLFIGEFNYRFNNTINNELTISNLSSTVYNNGVINSVSGVFIELYNISDENLVLTRFKLGSQSVSFNNFYLSTIYNEPELFDEVDEVLVIENYDFKISGMEAHKRILLRENMSIMLYVPFTYLGDIDYIHRFYFEIEYLNSEGKNSIIIDDIPYVSTSIFQSSLEKGYIVYEIPN